MNKLKLEIEELAVESFNTGPGKPPAGTVLAHSAAPCDTWDDKTCPYAPSCNGTPSCNGGYTCAQEITWYIEDDANPNTNLNCTGNCTDRYCFGGQP